MTSNLSDLTAAIESAADNLTGRNAVIVHRGTIVSTATEGGVTSITIEDENGGRYTATSDHVQLDG